MDVLFIQWLHVLSSMFLFGTGMGTAFFKYTTDLTGDVRAIAVVNRRVVLADWLFTAPTAVIQPVTGLLLAHLYGYPLHQPWLFASLLLYGITAACWLPVVFLQIRMRDDSARAAAEGTELPARYREDAGNWLWLGIPAFLSMLAILYLMVRRPSFGL
jgi:uncharacterized membrane protein